MTGPAPASIAVIGTGAFATGLCRSLAVAGLPGSSTVHVIGRDLRAGAEVCAAATGAAAGRPGAPDFQPMRTEIDPGTDFRPVLREVRPHIVVVSASLQSPSEFGTAGTRWAQLVRTAGFGVTLPLQAALATPVAAACADIGADHPVTLVNACFPDGVNPTLRARGLPVLCGLGNIGSLAAAVTTTLGLTGARRLKLLAHHAHLHEPPDAALEARCWVDDRPYRAVGGLLAGIRRAPRACLNGLGATAAAGVLKALADGSHWTGHLPGPLGLPGGFPVELRDGNLSLRLPPGVTLDALLRWTAQVSALDGVCVAPDGAVRYTDAAVEALRQYLPGLPATFAPQALPDLCQQLLALRERLRATEP